MNAETQAEAKQDDGTPPEGGPGGLSDATSTDDQLSEFTGGKALALGILFMLLGCLFWAWFAYVSASRVAMLGVLVVGWMAGLGVKRGAVGLGPQFMAACIGAIGIPIGLFCVTIATNVFIDGFPWDLAGIIGKTKQMLFVGLQNSTLFYFLACVACAFVLPADLSSSEEDGPVQESQEPAEQ